MNVSIALIVTSVVLGTPLSGEASQDKVQDAKTAMNDAVENLVRGNSRFALELYGRLRQRNGNLFFSPFNISTALAMTSLGARGETANEINKVFHFDPKAERLHPALSALTKDLSNQGSSQSTKGSAPRAQLSLANAIWAAKGERIMPDFLEAVQSIHSARFEQLDFARAAESSRQTINQWVEEKTQGKIKDLLKPKHVTPDTVIVLSSAIYFKGYWAQPFPASATREDDFHLGEGAKARTPMMNQTARFRYFDGGNFQMLELPYKDSGLSMLVLLPRKVEGIAELEGSLTLDRLDSWLGKLEPRKVKVSFPKFSATAEFELQDVLSSMGMPLAFHPGKADFSGITGTRNFFISAVVHKAFVEVEEKGTEAAAATGVVGVRAALQIQPEPVFKADHPFVYLIRDTQTGSILFMGRLSRP